MLTHEINEILNKGVETSDFPGANYAVIYKDGTILMDSVGYFRTHPEKIKNSLNTIYDCASLTKVVLTTTMILKLIEEQRIYLSSTISELLPLFKHDEITIEHLLTHCSGLPADIRKANTYRNRKQIEDYIYSVELINPVGKRIVYSDIGFILLGFVVEQITGKTLPKYATEVVIEPIGLENTSYHPEKTLCAPTEYRNDDVYKGYLQGKVHDEKSFALGNEAGHAGLFSTVQDISKFILSYLRNDGKLLKKETVDSLYPVRKRDVSVNGNPLIRSLGFNKPTKGGTTGSYSHFEDTILHTGFTGCNLWIDKQIGMGFVLLSNAVHPKRENNNIFKYRRMIADLIIPRQEEK